jgi:hypothetical protein
LNASRNPLHSGEGERHASEIEVNVPQLLGTLCASERENRKIIFSDRKEGLSIIEDLHEAKRSRREARLQGFATILCRFVPAFCRGQPLSWFKWKMGKLAEARHKLRGMIRISSPTGRYKFGIRRRERERERERERDDPPVVVPCWPLTLQEP